MPVKLTYFTDPACSASWANEPRVRRLMWEFGASLEWTFVMGGLSRDYPSRGEGVYQGLVLEWLEAAADSRMPIDPRLWSENPIRTTYPACMAVKAAQQQAADGGYAYLRALREGLLCFRRRLESTESLVDEARGAGLDPERFRIDLESHATVEAFGADLDRTRAVPHEARTAGEMVTIEGPERVPFPTLRVEGDGGSVRWLFGRQRYETYRAAVEEAGATAIAEPPPVLEALRRFGRMATVEVEAVCDLPGPRAAAELWQLSLDWRVRSTRVLTGWLWEVA